MSQQAVYGPEAAAERGEALAEAARQPVAVGKASVRIGTASWTDPTMTAHGVFYPPDADTAEHAAEQATEAFTDASAECQKRLQRLNAARARIAFNLQMARAEAERKSAA